MVQPNEPIISPAPEATPWKKAARFLLPNDGNRALAPADRSRAFSGRPENESATTSTRAIDLPGLTFQESDTGLIAFGELFNSSQPFWSSLLPLPDALHLD